MVLKIIGFFFLALFVLALIFGGVVWFNRTWLLSHYLSSSYGAPVHIDHLSLSSKRLIVQGFRIENPQGSAVPNAFSAQSVRFEVSPFAFLKEEVYIPLIEVQGATVGIQLYDLKGTDNNWSRLLQRMEKKKGRKQHYTVDTVTFDILNIDLYSDRLKKHIKVEPIENLVLDDVDLDDPLPVGAISARVSKAMFKQMLKKKPVEVLKGIFN